MMNECVCVCVAVADVYYIFAVSVLFYGNEPLRAKRCPLFHFVYSHTHTHTRLLMYHSPCMLYDRGMANNDD